jgi:exopolysaccharide biosynthesis polyprenyl glycosylphosphotransferase
VIPVVGTLADLPDLIRMMKVQEVIIASRDVSSEALFDTMMRTGRDRKVEYCFAPSLLDMIPQKTTVEQIGVLPMVRLFREPLSDAQRLLKRLSDVALGLVTLITTFPLWIVISVLIKFDSRGPVFFKQEGVGMDGRIFLCLKFRTMRSDSSDDLHRAAYHRNILGAAEANAGDAAEPVFGKVKDDPRITGVGRFLRRTSIDELPQVLNVLAGDMSIVGPRPPIPYEVEEYRPWQRKRLDMKPGLTGLWQVSGRNRLTFDEMVKVDLFYIENWSLLLDVKIIMQTLPAVIRGDGAK